MVKSKVKKMKLKKNSLVKVIAGQFRGLIDNIHHAEPKKERIYLAKATRQVYNKSPDIKKKSQLKEVMVPLHISNVMGQKKKPVGKKPSN
ncbi:MAG: hypothetical protein MRERV_77c006 [Mycoplasmataceae bacterium RV_VA103A]|nr:MAG: hypothetical protein MRERV_77c006 [Mycoplasmataceae bacterium RV_VA103A]